MLLHRESESARPTADVKHWATCLLVQLAMLAGTPRQPRIKEQFALAKESDKGLIRTLW